MAPSDTDRPVGRAARLKTFWWIVPLLALAAAWWIGPPGRMHRFADLT